jgi:hypothetical protein
LFELGAGTGAIELAGGAACGGISGGSFLAGGGDGIGRGALTGAASGSPGGAGGELHSPSCHADKPNVTAKAAATTMISGNRERIER